MAKIVPILVKFVALNLLFNAADPSINLALKKATKQSSNWSSTQYLSGNAVDGNTAQNFNQGTCTHTAVNKEQATLWVYLGDIYQIKRINIYYRNDQDGVKDEQRLNGYIIHINDWACYRDPEDALPSTLTPTHNCSYQGRQVSMTVRRKPGVTYLNYDGLGAIINLCELEIYGCDIGFYGNNCDTECGAGCDDGVCDPDDGTCTCKAGWKGNKCTEPSCPEGQYGQPCQPCPPGCFNGKCDVIGGQCIEGCVSGSHGSQCDQTCHENCADKICNQDTGNCIGCISGYHSNDCSIMCPTGCKGGICYQIGGNCSDGCVDLFTGKKCTECKNGYYGTTSCQHCPTGCLNNSCNAKDGHCSGCKNTFFGQHCNLTCPLNCRTESCNRVSGHCDKCKPRFHGTYCNLTCPVNCFNGTCYQDTGECDIGCTNGFHGLDCSSKCSIGCQNSNCKQTNGDCVGDCIEGFTNSQCTECEDGKHGEYCNNTCPATCNGHICYRYNGTCVNGCTNQNMTGSACDGCIPGFYGENCTDVCPTHCANSSCSKDSGHCFSCNEQFTGSTCTDCMPSYYGTLCSQHCPENCKNNTCDQKGGNCNGCIGGYFGEYCNKTCSCSPKECGQNDGICIESAAVASPNMAGPAAGAGVAVIIVIVIVVLVIIVVRRRRQKHTEDKMDKFETEKSIKSHGLTEFNNPKHTGGAEYVNALAVENGIKQAGDANDEDRMNGEGKNQTSQDIYMNDVSGEIPVSELNELISRKSKNNEFDEEYNKLPKGYKLPHVIGQKKENLLKNRFKTTFPYDHSRVVLEQIHGHPNSDYINANYIDGTEERKLYIATQGPKPNTLSDFWRMVWQENVGKIVMLTNLVENSKLKCDQYWPDYGESKDVVQMRITSESETEYSYFILRSFSLHNKKANETRHVKQFHFTMWPDHGTPDPIQLMLFHRKVKNVESDLTGPCVVHCAAGIGRTGTFIALDTLHEYGERTGKIDIYEYVRRMRDCRMNMIQTVEQYIVLHEALLESFQYVGRAMTKEQFFEACNEIQNGKPKNQTRIFGEFQNLTSLRPVYGIEYYEGAMEKKNQNKSRNQKILAVDKYRPYLTSHHSSRTDFINAVTLPSCTKRCGYIATHYPHKDTVEDLWCMIYDHDCKAVAVLDESGDKDGSLQWYPSESEEIDTWSFVITKITGPAGDNNVKRLDFNIKHKRRDEEKEVAIFILRPWSTKQCLPSSPPDFLQLIDRVDNYQKERNGPVTVICSDGAQCSGIFCAVSNVIQNLKLEDEIDIFHTVRQLQIRRPQFFMNHEEYESCYNIVKTYLESTNVYANT